jgi:hypothetical protein
MVFATMNTFLLPAITYASLCTAWLVTLPLYIFRISELFCFFTGLCLSYD